MSLVRDGRREPWGIVSRTRGFRGLRGARAARDLLADVRPFVLAGIRASRSHGLLLLLLLPALRLLLLLRLPLLMSAGAVASSADPFRVSLARPLGVDPPGGAPDQASATVPRARFLAGSPAAVSRPADV